MSIVEPPQIGFADWQPKLLYDGQPYISSSTVDPTTNPVLGPYSTANWNAINISTYAKDSVLTPSYNMYFEWYTDLTLETGLGQLDLWEEQGGGLAYLGLVVPNYGPWMQIYLSAPNADPSPIHFTVIPTNRNVGVQVGDLAATYATSTQSGIPPTDGISVSPVNSPDSGWFGGRGNLYAVATQDGTLDYRIYNGGSYVVQISFPYTANSFVTYPWVLPLAPWNFTYTNTSASNADATLVFASNPPSTY